jgi:hypothetical protein
MVQRRVIFGLAVGIASLGPFGCKSKENPPESAPEPVPTQPADSGHPSEKDKVEKEKSEKDKVEKENPETEGAENAESVDEPIALPEPPADVVEEVGAAPSPHHVWYSGYWHYDFPTRTYLWQPGFWIDREGFPHVAPEPERFEASGRAPGVGFFYVPGFWWWHEKYEWAPGHWLRRRQGFEYTHPHYENLHGRWESRGWGFEHRAPDFAHKHEGWDHRGDFWARPGYFHDRENYVREHASEVQERKREARRRPGEPERPPEKHKEPEHAEPGKHERK